MAATDLWRETIVETLSPVEPEARPQRRGGPGLVRRRLPVVGMVLALALGFAFGHVFDTSRKSAPKSIVTPAEINNAIASSGHGTAANDRGYSLLENGVQHTHGFELPLTPAERVELARQLEITRETALRYPTLADAVKGGLHRAGPFSPGLGTHMINYANYAPGAGTGPMTDDQIRRPLAWIYDGTKPTSRVAGLFYSANVANPAGFAGPNDVWHQHKNVCIVAGPDGIDAPLGADHDATVEQCNAVHGSLIQATGPLLHVWTVPGYEDSQGVFAHLNPAITCNDGTYYTVDITKIGTRTSACLDGSE